MSLAIDPEASTRGVSRFSALLRVTGYTRASLKADHA